MANEKIEIQFRISLSVEAANEFYSTGKPQGFSLKDIEGAIDRDREIMHMLNNLVSAVGAALSIREVLRK